MGFLSEKHEYSKNAVHRAGSAWRKGEAFDDSVIDEFLKHHAKLTSEILAVAEESARSLIIPMEKISSGPVKPQSGHCSFAARVKTEDTLVQKLRRMDTTPLHRIQDVSGARFDADVTLSEQEKIAEIFQNDLLNAGATTVVIKDMRDEPHSGYRAMHLHINAPAGRGELQIRTALQAHWANTYEVAADIYGRSIRYKEFGETAPEEATESVAMMHVVSGEIGKLEKLADQVGRRVNAGDRRIAQLEEEIARAHRDVYAILDRIHQGLSRERASLNARRN